MKTKKTGNKRVIMLNKMTIAHLNHGEMVGLKGGNDLNRDEGDLAVNEDPLEPVTGTSCDACPTPIDTGIFPSLSIIRNCN
jgi:hypothetical protein